MILINIIGSLVLSLFNIPFYKRSKIFSKLFLTQFTGLVFIITLYSCAKTSFQTINILLFTYPILLILFHYKSVRLNCNFISTIKIEPIPFIIFFVVYSF